MNYAEFLVAFEEDLTKYHFTGRNNQKFILMCVGGVMYITGTKLDWDVQPLFYNRSSHVFTTRELRHLADGILTLTPKRKKKVIELV